MKRPVAVLVALVVLAAAGATGASALSVLPSTVTITSTVPSQVYVGDSPTISGSVTTAVGLLGREVDLERDSGSGFAVIDTITASGDGSWVFSLPADTVGTFAFRVSAPGNLLVGPATSAAFTLSVVPHPAPQRLPQATPTTWQPLGPDDSSWSTCTPITYRVNTGTLRGYALGLVRAAIRQVQQATGFRFRYLGTTEAVPYIPGSRSGAMLTLAFVSPRRLGAHPTDAGGRAGYDNVGSTIVSAEAAFDAHLLAVARRLRGRIPIKLVLHELGHAMGLGHVTTPVNRMYPVISALGTAQYGPGDRLGLLAHGALAEAPCTGSVAARGAAAEHHVDSGWDGRVVLPNRR